MNLRDLPEESLTYKAARMGRSRDEYMVPLDVAYKMEQQWEILHHAFGAMLELVEVWAGETVKKMKEAAAIKEDEQ
jgi:hypothetical protein